MLSVIIPVYNEESGMEACLQALQYLRSQGVEIIVVDGGSSDSSIIHAQPLADKVLVAPKGRCYQMNAGAKVAQGETLLFLHADTRLPVSEQFLWFQTITERRGWGFFSVKLSSKRWPFRVIEALMNIRSRVTGIATGDQAIFVTKHLFEQVGGFRSQPLMEDIELSKHLKIIGGRPARPVGFVVTSSRRWEEHGIVSTVLLMWWLRGAYFLGASPLYLVQKYYR